jgi:serine/threonine protein kinase
MASVYLGRQKSLDVPRAIKILHPAFADDQDFISRFEREAKHGAAISHHPNIVGVVSYGNEEGRYYIAMELVEGTDLKSVLDAFAPLPPEIALILLEEVAKGLEAAHKLEIWHRDVKPSNVLLRRTGEVQIADFGLARNNRDRQRLAKDLMTMPGTVMGTLAYMSPEQHAGWDDNKIDHRTDIFALGVMAYELLTGERPFRGTESEVRDQAMNADPDPVSVRCPLATPPVEGLVAKLLAKRREDRCASMTEVLTMIREAMKSLDPDEDILKNRREYMRDFAADARAFCEKLNRENVAKNLALGSRLLEEDPPRTAEAAGAFSRVLLLDPENTEAERVLAELRGESVASRTSIDRTFPNRQWKKRSRGRPGGKTAAGKGARTGRGAAVWKRRPVTALLVAVPVLAAGAYIAWNSLAGKDRGDAVESSMPGGPLSSGDGAPAMDTTGAALTSPDTTAGAENTVDAGSASQEEAASAGDEIASTRPAAKPPARGPTPPRNQDTVKETTPAKAAGAAVELDATLSIRVLPSADVYVDGKLEREGAAGRISIPVSSARPHTLVLRSATGTKTFPDQKPNPYGLLDLGTFDFRTMPADP